MKNLMPLIILFIATAVYKPIEYIKIEHVGAGDKPIPEIIISSKPFKLPRVDNSLIYYEVVSDDDYTFLKNQIYSIRSDKFKVAEFGTFEISLCGNSKHSHMYYLNKKPSLQLFDKIIEKINKGSGNNGFLLDLKVIKKRLGA